MAQSYMARLGHDGYYGHNWSWRKFWTRCSPQASNSNFDIGLRSSPRTLPLLSRLLPGWRDRLPSIRIPSAHRNRSHLGGCTPGLTCTHRRHPHLPNPRPIFLGRQQCTHRPLLLPHYCRCLPSLSQMANRWSTSSLLDHLQARYPRHNSARNW